MKSNNNGFGKLLRKYGYKFPETEEEVVHFEKNSRKKFQEPSEWPSIEDILSNELKKENFTQTIDINRKDASSLAMAAREGKKITKEVRERMEKDKKNAKK